MRATLSNWRSYPTDPVDSTQESVHANVSYRSVIHHAKPSVLSSSPSPCAQGGRATAEVAKVQKLGRLLGQSRALRFDHATRSRLDAVVCRPKRSRSSFHGRMLRRFRGVGTRFAAFTDWALLPGNHRSANGAPSLQRQGGAELSAIRRARFVRVAWVWLILSGATVGSRKILRARATVASRERK